MIADAIYDWSLSDGGHEGFRRNFPADYRAPLGDGLWVSTSRAKAEPSRAMQPGWGDNRPFILTSGEECAPPAPPAYSEAADSAFYREALEVYTMTEAMSAEQREIARFWSDDPFRTATPAGHSVSILTQTLALEQATLATAAEAYAKLGIALADSFISCWHAKYQYNLIRPVSYIQQHIDPAWGPLLTTPPFPEYPSGHSVMSSAAAGVLTALFGADYAFSDHTHDEWGLASRSFASFTDFAREAAVSRIYGGIHFRSAVELGLEQGDCVAARVNQLHFRR
jgi:membrane-associated phospholipid phosphatase